MIYANEMIEASRGQIFAGMTDKEQASFFSTEVHRLYDMKGIEPSEKDVPKWVEELVAGVRRFKGITAEEIALALKYGLAENFSKDTRLVCSNFLLWIERYMTHPERLEAVQGSRAAERRQDALLLNNEAEIARRNAEFRQNAPRREWERFKANGGRLDILVDGYAAAVYDALDQRGKIRVKPETLEQAQKRARAELLHEAHRKRGVSVAVAAGLDFGNGEEYRTKRILLETYFRNLAARGVELS